MRNTTRRPNIRHYLATVEPRLYGKGLYVFTGLGEFKTAEAAQAKWRSNPRNGTAVILRHWDAVRLGMCYGTCAELLDVDTLAIIPMP